MSDKEREQIRAAIKAHQKRDAALRRQGAEEFRERTVRECEAQAEAHDSAAKQFLSARDEQNAQACFAKADAWKRAADMFRALPLEEGNGK